VLSNWSSQDGWLETKIRLPLLQEKFFSKQTSSIIPRFLGILKNRNTEATAKMQLKTKPVFLKELNSSFISCNGALETSSGERPKDNSLVSSCQGGLSAIFTTSRKGVYTCLAVKIHVNADWGESKVQKTCRWDSSTCDYPRPLSTDPIAHLSKRCTRRNKNSICSASPL